MAPHWSRISEAAFEGTIDSERHDEDHPDRRGIIERTEAQLRRSLSEEQMMTINNHLNFGWKFHVRDLRTDNPTAFIVSPDESQVVLIDEDGELVYDHQVAYRP